MILEETKMASVVLDEEEAPSEPSATLLDGDDDEGASKEEETSADPSATLLDGDGDEGASKEGETPSGAPAEDGTM